MHIGSMDDEKVTIKVPKDVFEVQHSPLLEKDYQDIVCESAMKLPDADVPPSIEENVRDKIPLSFKEDVTCDAAKDVPENVVRVVHLDMIEKIPEK